MELEIKDRIKIISKVKNLVTDKNATLLNFYISGSDLYGWRSKNSDIDFRGGFVLNQNEFLGLTKPSGVVITVIVEDILI